MRVGGKAEEVLNGVLEVDEGTHRVDASSRLVIEKTGWYGVGTILPEEANIVGIYSQAVNLGNGLKIAGLPFSHAMGLGEERQQEAEHEIYLD